MLFDLDKTIFNKLILPSEFWIGRGKAPRFGLQVDVFDVTIPTGAVTSIIAAAGVRADSVTLGVTLRVITALAGSTGNISLGRTGSTALYRAAEVNTSWIAGFTVVASNNTAPALEKIAANTDIILTSTVGSFTGGRVRLAVYRLPMVAP